MAKQLKIAFLGGVGEIGKNMTAVEYGDNIFIIDCGSMFPTNETPGIDLVIPDFNYIVKNKDKVRAILLTHGHEDHIGGMPYLLKELPDVKVYGSKLTLALLQHKLNEAKITMPKCVCVDALAISTPIGVIFHTGDFKIDYTPIDSERADLSRFAKLGDEGVLLMLGESTNIEKNGYSMSESAVGATIDKLFANNLDSRIIIATFASNVHRLQQIINICEKFGRKVVFNGRSMLKVSELAKQIGELTYKTGTVIETEEMNKYPNKKICIISTGSQGEPMSALTRMANGEDKIIVGKNDVIILSSSPIPGNEKYVYTTINNLYQRGAKVIYGSLDELHVSGHACKEELKLMLSLIRPKFFIPVHGEYRHLKQHEELAMALGVPQKNISICEIGSQIEIRKTKLAPCENITAGSVYVDGLMDVDDIVLRDRTQLSKDGFVVCLLGVSMESNSLASTPDIIARGLQFTEDILDEIKDAICTMFENFSYHGSSDRGSLKASVRRIINNIIKARLKQRPMILPIIMEI